MSSLPRPLDLLSFLLPGVWVTVKITALTAVIAFPLAILAGLARLSRFRPLRLFTSVYVEVFRGTSALVQILYFYFVLPRIGLPLPPLVAGVLALSLNIGAYGSEVVRGAIRAVDRGQYEAGIALNLSASRIMGRIILPQAAARIIPPFGNLLIELLKSTPLLSLITITDLLSRGQILVSLTHRLTDVYGLVLICYFIIAWPIARGLRKLDSTVVQRQ